MFYPTLFGIGKQQFLRINAVCNVNIANITSFELYEVGELHDTGSGEELVWGDIWTSDGEVIFLTKEEAQTVGAYIFKEGDTEDEKQRYN